MVHCLIKEKKEKKRRKTENWSFCMSHTIAVYFTCFESTVRYITIVETDMFRTAVFEFRGILFV